MSFQIELVIDPTITDGDYMLEYNETNTRSTIIKVDDLEATQMSIIGLDFKLRAEDLEFTDPSFNDPENNKRYVQLSQNFIPFQVRERKNFYYGMGNTLSETRERSVQIKKFVSRLKGRYVILVIRDSEQVNFATPIKTVLTKFFGRSALEQLQSDQSLVILAEKRQNDQTQSNLLNVLVSKADNRVRWLVQTSSPFINLERWNQNFRFQTQAEIKSKFTDLFEHLENLIGQDSAFRDIVDKLGHHVGSNRKLDGTNTSQDIQIPWYTTYPEDLDGDSELIRTNLTISAKASQVMGLEQLSEKRQKIMRQSFLSKRAHQLLVDYIQLYEEIKKNIQLKLDL